jgi:glycosyltransferase involved in cell wall biosynthesis
MRILALTNLYPNPFHPHRAPFSRHWLRILGERHDVRVISPIAWTMEWRARLRGAPPLPPGRRIVNDNLVVDHPRLFFIPRACRGWYGYAYLASIQRTFDRVAAEHRPELVYTSWAYPDGWAAVRLARRHRIPAILQVHGSDIRLLEQYPSRKKHTAEALREASGVVAVSQDLAKRVVALGAVADRIRVIYDGVDSAIFCPGEKSTARARIGVPDGDPLLLYIGNLVPVKGIDVLIDACARLAAERFPFRLFILGQGPFRRTLERQADRLGLGACVRFMGSMPQSELAHWYRAADCFVLPSRSEGVPNVLLEAMACGVRWVATAVGGVPEIARAASSRLVSPGRPDELARAIRESLAAGPPGDAVEPKYRTAAVEELEAFLAEVLAVGAPAEATEAVP